MGDLFPERSSHRFRSKSLFDDGEHVDEDGDKQSDGPRINGAFRLPGKSVKVSVSAVSVVSVVSARTS